MEPSLKEEEVCEFYSLINKLQHMVRRNMRFTNIQGDTNIHSKAVAQGLTCLGMNVPAKVMWRLMELLTNAGQLNFDEHGDYDSCLSIDALLTAWEAMTQTRTQKAA